MPLAALLLALAAAFLHAGWNLLLARAGDPEAATAVAFAVSVAAFAPVAVLTWRVEGAAVPFILGSAALELAYVALLGAAYRRAHLSLVYPVARGVAPVLVLLISVIALGAGASPAQAAGVCVVGAGVLLVRGSGGRADARGLLLSGLIAASIAGYTLVDRSGVRHANAVTYLELVLLGPALAYPLSVRAARGRGALRAELRLPVLAAGFASFTAYLLVLLALRQAAAAPVAAVRETSVVIATVLAASVLGEPVGARRIGGAIAVAGGVAAIALGG